MHSKADETFVIVETFLSDFLCETGIFIIKFCKSTLSAEQLKKNYFSNPSIGFRVMAI